MKFCPCCGSLLILGDQKGGKKNMDEDDPNDNDKYNFFKCQTCSYQHEIEERYVSYSRLNRKAADDVHGGEEAWENVDRTTAKCPRSECNGKEAFFMQIQIRSADEPMTTFYRCCTCMRQWND